MKKQVCTTSPFLSLPTSCNPNNNIRAVETRPEPAENKNPGTDCQDAASQRQQQQQLSLWSPSHRGSSSSSSALEMLHQRRRYVGPARRPRDQTLRTTISTPRKANTNSRRLRRQYNTSTRDRECRATGNKSFALDEILSGCVMRDGVASH